MFATTKRQLGECDVMNWGVISVPTIHGEVK